LIDVLTRARGLEGPNPFAATKACASAAALATTPTAQALAIAGVARTQASTGERAAAVESWRSIIRRYPDIHSPSGRPYGLIGAVELSALRDVNDEQVSQMREALLSGRWALTPDQADYFYDQLSPGSRLPSTPFAETLAVATRLRAAFHAPAAVQPNEILPATLSLDGVDDQLYLIGHANSGMLLGLVADLRYAELHGFTVTTEIASALPPVAFDAVPVEQAVMNLLDNAAKYCDSTAIAVRMYASAGSVTIEVEDQGVGIPAEEQPAIFERFTRGSHPDRGGYGFGLYLVRHIVQAHGGQVELSSAPGQGSRFRLLFPVVANEFRGPAHAQGLTG
jgi:hypothetical protein